LSSNWTHSHLASLSIINTPLTQIPRYVCRLTSLIDLHLDYNQLTQLPDNCLSNLSNLVRFSAHDNAIKTLQNGVFDGLTKLQYLDLNKNRISSIGLSVFATSSNLSSLLTIVLSENDLTSLEPWVYDRGIIGSFDRKVLVYLNRNKISKFTNKMGFYPGLCYRKIPFGQVDLRNNSIKHIMDIFTGWQLNIMELLICCKVKNGELNFGFYFKGNNIACDCISYGFFRLHVMLPVLQNVGLQNDISKFLNSHCYITDPLTGKSSIVTAFKTDFNLFVCKLTDRCPGRCICVHRPHNATLHIYCSDRNLTALPYELPELPDRRTKYKLDFSNNRLLYRLDYRDYFINTSILDISNSGVNEIKDWEEIAKVPVINLFGNKISALPPTFLLTNITTGMLNLANNPWDCSCNNKWMSKWFNSIADRLTQKVLCYSPSRLHGKNIVEVSGEEFCVDPTSKAASKAVKTALTISLSAVASVFLVLLFIGITIYRLRVKLYTRWKFHPFDRDECLGEDMDYDVFLSCSSNDNLPLGNEIREQLEQHGYRVCYPPRDFLAGDTIYDNIYNAVVNSKRTVCLLTEHFLQRFTHVVLYSIVSPC